MAITYLQQPITGSIQSSDNPITFVFSSNQTTQANFCFIVQTLINGAVISTDKVFPERGSRAHWDASKITLNSIKPTTRLQGQLVLQKTLPQVQVRVAERYGTTPVTQAFSDGNKFFVHKARCSDEVFEQDWLTNNYPKGVKWLTDCPGATQVLSKKSPLWASMLVDDIPLQMEANVYDVNGNLLGVISEQPPSQGQLVNVCITPTDIETAIQPLTMEDVHRMEVYINQSEALFITFVPNECTEFHQLSWMNNLGAYDQFLFGHNHDQESAISSLEYKKQFGQWDTANVFGYDTTTSGDTTYVKTIQPSGTLYTGWISQAFQNWLNQIYYSVDTLLLEGNVIERIVVTDTKSMEMKSRFDETLNFQVGYKKTNFKSITQ